jgi:hypothetical protein
MKQSMRQLDYGHREGLILNEETTADGRLNRGFRWTALEHMDDTTNDLAALTQRRHMERPCNQIE